MKPNLNSQAATSLLQCAQWLNVQISGHLEPVELTLQQLKILHVIWEQKGRKATVNQIKSKMIDPKSNVSRLLNKLMEKQFVTKQRDGDDQRVVYISITKLGTKQMIVGKNAMDKGMAIMEKLDFEELSTFIRLSEKLRA